VIFQLRGESSKNASDMKTSQQIAEEMVTRCIISWASKLQGMGEVMHNEIPLTQLIEVARAAEAYWQNSKPEPNCYRKSQDLDNALIALKQTGKAEWL